MRETKPKAKPTPTYAISDCIVNNGFAANEHTRAAVEALAGAAKANAEAIAEIARALKGSASTMENAFKFGPDAPK